MGIKKVLLSLGLCTLVSVSGMAMANAKAAPENGDRAQQECPEGERCDRPAPDQQKLKKGAERREETAPEGKAPRKAKHDADIQQKTILLLPNRISAFGRLCQLVQLHGFFLGKIAF